MRGSGPAELCAAIDVCVLPGRIQHMREPADGQQEARGFARPLWNGRGPIPRSGVPQVVEQVFAGTDRRPKPYEGVSTLLGAPLRLDAPGSRDLGGLDAALVGVPMDLGVTNRAGARLGPRGCGRSSASAPIITCIASRRSRSARWPTSATCRSAAASAWRTATRTSRPSSPAGGGRRGPLSVGGDHSITRRS